MARSASRPATSVLVLLQVERKSARARACKDRRRVGGVGGGVAITRWEISLVGVAGADGMMDVDARRRESPTERGMSSRYLVEIGTHLVWVVKE